MRISRRERKFALLPRVRRIGRQNAAALEFATRYIRTDRAPALLTTRHVPYDVATRAEFRLVEKMKLIDRDTFGWNFRLRKSTCRTTRNVALCVAPRETTSREAERKKKHVNTFNTRVMDIMPSGCYLMLMRNALLSRADFHNERESIRMREGLIKNMDFRQERRFFHATWQCKCFSPCKA